MSVSLSPLFNGFQAFDAGGVPLAGGLLNTYQAGTNIPAATYTTISGGVANSNPIVLDAGGYPPFEVWLTDGQAYEFVLTDALGLNPRTFDNIYGIADAGALAAFEAELAAGSGASLVGFTQNAGVARTVQTELRESYSPMQFGAAGDGVTDDTTAVTLCWAQCPAYGTIDLRAKTYMITSAIPRPAVGVIVQGGKFYLNNPASFQIYALVANDECVFDSIHFLGTGAIGTTTTVTFTASVGSATSGTLTSAITNGNYIFTFSDASTRYVTVTGGTAVSWTGALAATTILSATYPTTPRYQGGIFGGNTGYASPMNTTPANNVTVRSCLFDSLTVGVWSGGATGDPVPVGWRVTGNTFRNMVGVPSLSEGYGCLFTPSNDGVIANNFFQTIRRHAVYLASEASNNAVVSNVIDGVDNIGIQSNTGVTQNYADGNVISGNTLRGFTKSVPYGYSSSVGIGIYGKVKNAVIVGNKIFGPLDIGIDTEGELSGSAYSDRLLISDNQILLDPTADDSGIRLDGLQSGKVSGNNILLQGANQNGMTITSNYTTATTVIDISGNTIETLSSSQTLGFRVALSAPRTVKIYRNTLNGFAGTYASKITDTSTSGIVRTDLNSNDGVFATDAGFTVNAGGTVAQTDCPAIRHTGTLTAGRTVTLSNANVPDGYKQIISRPGTGAFNLGVNDSSAGLIKNLATGTWGQFGWNGTAWEELATGSL